MMKRTSQGIMTSFMPIQGLTEKLQKKVTQVQCWNGAQKRGQNKENDLSQKTKGPKDATKQKPSKNLIS